MSEGQVITAEHIERAERLLKTVYAVGIGDNIILDRARVVPEDFENFLRHHRNILFNGETGYLKDIDPRQEPAILTMFRHMFAVGAIAQRVAEGRS